MCVSVCKSECVSVNFLCFQTELSLTQAMVPTGWQKASPWTYALCPRGLTISRSTCTPIAELFYWFRVRLFITKYIHYSVYINYPHIQYEQKPYNHYTHTHGSDSCETNQVRQYHMLKVHNVFPKVTFPPWLHPVKIWLQTVSR